jgi:hypothetical protein
MFGPRKGVVGSRRRRHNEELHNLHASLYIIKVIKSRRMRWVGYVARMGDNRNAYKILVGKPERKRLLGRRRCRWECSSMNLWIA